VASQIPEAVAEDDVVTALFQGVGLQLARDQSHPGFLQVRFAPSNADRPFARSRDATAHSGLPEPRDEAVDSVENLQLCIDDAARAAHAMEPMWRAAQALPLFSHFHRAEWNAEHERRGFLHRMGTLSALLDEFPARHPPPAPPASSTSSEEKYY
jgi:hypothetical protein